MGQYRETSWLSIILAADPEFQSHGRRIVEYSFSGPGGKLPGGEGSEEEQQLNHGNRIFVGDYKRRGPYRPEE